MTKPTCSELQGIHMPTSPAQETCWSYKPLRYTSSDMSDTHSNWFLRVCGINDTHLRDDTAKYLCAYIKIAASLEKKNV